MRRVIHRVAELGLKLHATHLPDGILGYYSRTEHRIYFDLGLTPSERESVIAHELGHAFHNHGCDSPKHERQADTYAAELLIDPVEYASLERMGGDDHYIADELGITVDLVQHYRTHCLQRIGARTYATAHNSRLTNRLARALTP